MSNLPAHFRISKIIIAIGFTLVAYMIYILTASIYNGYMLDRHIARFKVKNEEIAKEYKNNLDNLKYFESNAYAEKIAKEQLGLVNQGEEVLILLGDNSNSETEQELVENEEITEYRRMKNPQRWWYYFFG